MFYLLELKRTIRSGTTYYWTNNRYIYTTNLEEAFLFSGKAALEHVNNDRKGRTLMIHKNIIESVLQEILM